MIIKKIITVGVAVVAMGAMALDNVEVTDVKARQRYPWNGKVDIDFTLDSKPTEPYQMQVEVYDNVGKTNLPVKSVCTENVSVEANPCMVRTDTTRIVWDAAKDLPNGFKCTNVLVTCRDARLTAVTNRYLIVDISAGSSASSFPVSYTNCPPSGGWDDEFLKTKIAFRRIEAGSFLMGSAEAESGHNANEVQHKVTLTKPYYMAVYPLTQYQYYQIKGSGTLNTQPMKLDYGNIRGWDVMPTSSLTSLAQFATDGDVRKYRCTISQNSTLSDYCFPNTSNVEANSLVGIIRLKTGMVIDLPTEAQWEMAGRAGSLTPLYIGTEKSDASDKLVQLSNGLVGTMMPNAWEIYDISACNGEWCLDAYSADLKESDTIDPVGGNAANCLSVRTYVSDQYMFGQTKSGQSSFNTYFKINFGGTDYTRECGQYSISCYLLCKGIGVNRVVRSLSTRVASRSYAYCLNPNVAIIESGLTYWKTTAYYLGSGTFVGNGTVYKVAASAIENPKYCVRLCVADRD